MDKKTLDAVITRIEQWKVNAGANADNARTVETMEYYRGMEDAYKDAISMLKD